MTQHLRALPFFPSVPGFSSQHAYQAAHNSIFREANVLFWPLQVLDTYGEHTYPRAHIRVHTYTQNE